VRISTSEESIVERDGLASDGAFTIQFNAKMAKILSDGLYSDKIGSIIRELSCNAVDSHVDAGKAREPIEVHLPTLFEPFFHVRDFGTGLDHAQVIGIYTCYGASTKTNSNDFIGQLGLGSKSPFSYVDAFDVTAIKDGVERQYSMYKNEQGMPSVALLGEKPTTESNGVTVKMPVKQEDMRRFSEKAARVFRWFSVRPKITGVESLSIQDLVPMFEGNGWKICKKNDSYYAPAGANSPVALMGRVAYPLDANSLPDLSKAQAAMISLPLVLEFGIGDLEVAASREALGYDKRTQANIKAKLDQLITELAVEFEKKISAAKTEWDARRLFGEIFGHESGFRYEFERAYGNHGLKWRGMVIKDAHVTIDTKLLWDPAAGGGAPGIYNNTARYKRARRMSYHDNLAIRCTDRTVFVFDDLDKGGLSRVNYAIETDSGAKEYVFFEHSPLKTVQQILKMLGNPPHVMASSLPKRPSTARGTKVNFLRYAGSGVGQSSWTPVDITLEDGGIYVLLDRWSVLRDGDQVSDLGYIVDRAQALGILSKDDVIYAPRGHYRSKITAEAEWTNLWDLVKAEVNKRLTPAVMQTVADGAHYTHAMGVARDTTLWRTNWNLQHPKEPFGVFVETMRVLERTSAASAKDVQLIELAEAFGNQVQNVKPSTDAHLLHQHMMSHYPMLSFVFADRYSSRSIHSKDDAMRIQAYVNLVDSAEVRRREENMAALDPVMAEVVTA
jgi:hypothetical protein